jgi:hypothetical protein
MRHLESAAPRPAPAPLAGGFRAIRARTLPGVPGGAEAERRLTLAAEPPERFAGQVCAADEHPEGGPA